MIAAALLLLAAPAQAGTPSPAIKWVDGHELTVEGQAFRNLAAPWDRLPMRAEGVVRDPVWDLSRDSAGIAIRFSSDAPAIHARWKLTRERLAMPHMAKLASLGG
ncbi:MAG TPA: SGNH/GDSL hydrolase N-terminal domain-containing protein [Planctomycetota bacterium]